MIFLRRAFWASLIASGLSQGELTAASFVDVTQEAGLDTVHAIPGATDLRQQPFMSAGAAAGDFDGDGWVDLYVTRDILEDKLYRNLGDGTFENVSSSAFGPDHLVGIQTNGASWGDIDNDGDLDLYVTTMLHPQHLLFINDGNGKFVEEAVARGAHVPDANGLDRYGFSSTFGDFDGDGYLDLHVTDWRLAMEAGNDQFAQHNTRLLKNRGASEPGVFDDVTDAAGVGMEQVPTSLEELSNAESFVSRFSDIDRDGHPDLLIVADHNASRLFWNDGDGTFTDGTVAANVGKEHNGMGSALGDIDNDGDFDWFVTAIFQEGSNQGTLIDRDGNRLYRYDGDRSFTDITDAAGVRDGGWGWAAAFLDYDNDGDLDLAMTNGMDHPSLGFDAGFEFDQSVFWENDGSGAFTNVSSEVGFFDADPGKGLLKFDYDNDGDLDVFITNNSKSRFAGPVLYRNDGQGVGNWLRIDLVGTISNAQAVGTFVTVTKDLEKPGEIMLRELNAGNHFLSQSETTLHYGLGTSHVVDEIRFEWPDGSVTFENDVAADQLISVSQPKMTTGVEAIVEVGDAFDFEVQAISEIDSFSASNLPEGLSINEDTGVVSGVANQVGRFLVDLEGSGNGATEKGSIQILVTTTYSAWIDRFYPGEDNLAVIGPLEDPDGDGRGNGEEYATQTNPAEVGEGLDLAILIGEADSNALPQATYRQFSGGSDFVSIVEESTDLINWMEWSGATELSRVDEGGGIEAVTLERSAVFNSGQDVFVRVRRVVSLP